MDNAATTVCLGEVAEVVQKAMLEEYGNPSSRHFRGVQAERVVKEAQAEIAQTLKVSPQEIYFTSGGTESDNWAVFGAAWANRRAGMHVIATAVEHPAVLQPMRCLEELGFRVTYLAVDGQGRISLEDLREALCAETVLVSVMYVNNEVGTVEPVEAAARLVKSYNPRILFHTDAVQAYGKYRIYPKRMGIDLLSASGHKIHGPKGVGFLYLADTAKVRPILLGGGQQRGMRSGTDNVPGIAGLGVAARLAYADFDRKVEHLYALRKQLLAGIADMEDAVALGRANEGDGAPHIVCVSFLGVRSEVLLHALEERGVCVSSGSACSANKKASASPVLAAMGLPKQALASAVRFSFGALTTEEEIAYALEQVRELLPRLRRYARH